MAETQNLTLFRACDYLIRMRLRTVPDPLLVRTIPTWNVVLEIRETAGGVVLVSSAGSLALVPDAEKLGVWDFPLSAAQTTSLTKYTYVYAIRRTDVGYVDVLTKGQILMSAF